MAVINNIYFSCKLQLPDAASWIKQGIVVQFKTSMMDYWVNLIAGKINEEGLFEAFYVIPDRISTSDIPLRAFREILEAGGIPDLRLVLETDLSESIVFVQSGDFEYDNKETLHYGFHNASVLAEGMWKSIPVMKGYSEEYKLITTVADQVANDDETAKLKAELEAVSMLAKEATSKMNELQSDKTALEQTIKNNIEQIDQLKEEVSQKEKELANQGSSVSEETIIQLNDLKALVDTQKLQVEALEAEETKKVKALQTNQTTIANLTAELENIRTLEEESTLKLEALQGDKMVLQETIQQNLGQIDQLKAEVYQKENELADKESTIPAETVKEIAELQALVGTQEKQIEALQTEEAEKVKLVAASVAEMDTVKGELDQIKTVEEENNALLETLQMEKATLEQTVVANVVQIDQLTAAINQKDVDLADKDKSISDLEDEVALLNGKLYTAQEQVEVDAATPFEAKALPASTVYTSILSEVQKAKNTTTDSGYRLATLSLNLKTTVEQDGDGMRLKLVDSQSASSLNGNAISDISLSIVDDSVSTVTTSNTSNTPSVVGLTETAARKRLQAYGLRLSPVYEYNTGQTIGQAFKQSPTHDEAYVPNQTVTVVFSKK